MKKSVLAVDDSRTILNMLERYLKDNYEIHCTLSGDEALQVMQKHSIDIVLLDIMMPVMNGMMVLKKIREVKEYESIPVLFLTGDAHRAKVIESFQMGSQGYILKPVAKEELEKRIEETMQKHKKSLEQKKEEEKKAEEEKKLFEEQKKEEEKKRLEEKKAEEEKRKQEEIPKQEEKQPESTPQLGDIYKDLQVRQEEAAQAESSLSLLDAFDDVGDILDNFVKREE